jgi:predicted acetyltransferase
MGFAFRQARAEDIERLVEIHAAAYPDGRRRDARVTKFTANPLGTLDDLWVAANERGALVAHAFLFPLKAWFGGRQVAVGGVASVAVSPESRGLGVASALLERVCQVSRERGDALVMLYPFRQGFYRRLGFAPTSRSRLLRVAPSGLPRLRGDLAVRAAVGEDRGAMLECWGAAARSGTGRLARSVHAWDARLADETLSWLVVEGGGGVEGYIAWSITRSDDAETTLDVGEMVARSDRGTRAIWAAIAAQRDQVQRVEVEIADDDPIVWTLEDAEAPARGAPYEAWHPIGEVVAGPMIRLTEASRALEARGWLRDGELNVEVDGQRLHLTTLAGVGAVTPTNAAPDVCTDARTFASVVLGGLAVADAARLGRIVAPSAAAIAAAGAMLDLRPFFSPDRF